MSPGCHDRGSCLTRAAPSAYVRAGGLARGERRPDFAYELSGEFSRCQDAERRNACDAVTLAQAYS
jgi:hypothetical protein